MASAFLPRIVKNIQAMLRALSDNGIYVWPYAGTPVDGTTGANVIDIYGFIVDTTTGTVFQNTGTLSSPVWSSVAGPRVIAVKKTVLTSAQVLALRATPITLVAAPGAGLILDFVDGSAQLIYGGTNAFTNIQDLAVKRKDGTGAKVTSDITGAGVFDQAASTSTSILKKINVQETKAALDNQPLVIHNIGASEITGNAAADNTIQVKIAFRITSVGW